MRDQKEDQFTLVLPCSDDVVLGGTAQVGSWDRIPTGEDTKLILQRCSNLVPEIADSEILGESVGLRPGRPEVRLELEQSPAGNGIIHNYDHGGGGFTVAWGCAEETAQLASDYFNNNDLYPIS